MGGTNGPQPARSSAARAPQHTPLARTSVLGKGQPEDFVDMCSIESLDSPHTSHRGCSIVHGVEGPSTFFLTMDYRFWHAEAPAEPAEVRILQ